MDSGNNQVEEIKNRLDITQVVSKYVQLKQAGKNFSGLCPFHQEKTPSFIVSPDIQRYKCFGCGESGDIFNFVEKIEHIDFPEALEKLAKEAGVELKKTNSNPIFKKLEDINYLATKYYFSELKKDKIANKYVHDRGYTDESIKTFGIGYAPQYPKLLEYIKKSGTFTKKELIESGLFVEKNGTIREKFYNRIMFPIRSTRGKVIAFSGRILPGNDNGPKYMNSPETPIFHKKNNLFGQYEARQEIRKMDLAILCEGQTDMISTYQHGIKNIVAPLGTGLTKEQLQSVSQLTKNILFFFDSDSAGQKAAIRAFELASELNLTPYAANPEPYKDIDEMIQKEPERLKALIDEKQEAFSYIFTHFVKDLDVNKLEDFTKIRKFLSEILHSLNDPILKTHYLEKASKITMFDFVEEMEKVPDKADNLSHEKSPVIPVKEICNLSVRYYMYLLIHKGKIDDEYLVPFEILQPESVQKIYKYILENKNIDAKKLGSTFESDEGVKLALEEIMYNTEEIPSDIDKELRNLAKIIKKEYLEDKIEQVRKALAISEEQNKTERSEKLLQKAQELSKLLNNLEK